MSLHDHLTKVRTEEYEQAVEWARDVVEAAGMRAASDYPDGSEQFIYEETWKLLDTMRADAVVQCEAFTEIQWEEICYAMACYADEIGYDQINERMN